MIVVLLTWTLRGIIWPEDVKVIDGIRILSSCGEEVCLPSTHY